MALGCFLHSDYEVVPSGGSQDLCPFPQNKKLLAPSERLGVSGGTCLKLTVAEPAVDPQIWHQAEVGAIANLLAGGAVVGLDRTGATNMSEVTPGVGPKKAEVVEAKEEVNLHGLQIQRQMQQQVVQHMKQQRWQQRLQRLVRRLR